ncbi:MAG: hypothetical protein H6Q00_2861 [Holophagaceae bacterium]|nr:hypothetical protein [Holophagaceae bacterium]
MVHMNASRISLPHNDFGQFWHCGYCLQPLEAKESALTNSGEHNFTNGYLCSVGQDDDGKLATYPVRDTPPSGEQDPAWGHEWWWRYLNVNVRTGEIGCLDK